MIFKTAVFILITSLPFSSVAGKAAAMDRQSAIGVLRACGADSKKFCASVVPGGGRIVACLDEHRAQLSDLCAGAVAPASLCVEDMRRFCSSVPGGGMAPCLKRNAAQLSPQCRNAMARAISQ